MSASHPDIPPSGLVATKYQLVKLIGRGGMGSVWEARHVSLGTSFAIKFIEAEYADSVEARSRFDKEAKAAATIQSKHAIQIYDHGVTEDGKPYIVMELLQGEPLDKRIERTGTIPLQETARIIAQVSRGLVRAHEQGIVHRDLKPENIFLVRSPDEDEEIAKVLDFGIAKMQGASAPGLTSSTKTGAVLGTPFYMSPEQARGLRNVDHRTDVWSLGVIAFKCVMGRLPFDGESVGDLLVKICTAPIPVPSQMSPGLPASFDAWFLRALEREPDRRFSTVTELADGLNYAAGLGGRPSAVASGPSPMMAMPTVGASSQQQPLHTPGHGTAPVISAPPQTWQPTPQPHHHANVTSAPFTSSTQVPGVPSGRGKIVVASIFAALLGLGIVGAVAVVAMRPTEPARASTNAIPPEPTPSPDKPVEPPPDPIADPPGATPAAPLAKTDPPKPAAQDPAPPKPLGAAHKPAPKPPAPAAKPPVTPPPPPPAPVTAAPKPPTPPTPPAPKPKPNTKDPGY
jgi:eukaryotic-like serine/threonine-protein kinase